MKNIEKIVVYRLFCYH